MGDESPLLVVHTLCDMYGSSGGAENPSTRRVEERCRDVMRMYDEWRKEPLPRLITGHDLLALGFRPGPLVGAVLAQVRERQIAGEMKIQGRSPAICACLPGVATYGERAVAVDRRRPRAETSGKTSPKVVGVLHRTRAHAYTITCPS